MASIGGHKSQPKSKSSPDTEETHELTIYGKNGMYNDVYSFYESPIPSESSMDTVTDEIYTAGRPTNFLNRMLKATTFWQPYALMDYYMREVSILATIKSRSVIEIFRYGVEWQPKFVKKCADCGREYDNDLVQCDCGSRRLYEPDKLQQDYFSFNGISFLDE